MNLQLNLARPSQILFPLCASIPKNNAKTKSMTKTFKIIFLSIIIGFTIQTRAQNVFSSDVDNFWKAYDKITKTKDSILQKNYLKIYISQKEQKV
ncbi:hypothetical protein LDL59_10840 [Kaistella anthropi]|nr:hypothetical protein [Kaistella anthropi]